MPQRAIAPVTFQYRKPVRNSLVWWLRCFGIAAFVVLLLRLPQSQQAQLSRIDLRWLGFCLLFVILQLLLEAFVWQWLLATQRIRYPYPKTVLTYLASQYLGFVTPGHVGELLAAGYISMDTGITFGYALSSVVMKKALHWVTVIGFGVWGLPLLTQMPFLQGVQRLVWISLGVLVALSGGIWLWVVSLRKLAKKWQKLSPWQIDMTEFKAGLRALLSVKLLVPLLMAALAFSLLFAEFNAVLRSLDLHVSLIVVAQILALSRFAARLVPISVAGFGSKDAAVIWLLSQHGVAVPVVTTAAILFHLCTYLLTLLLSGLCWWVKPLMVRRARHASS